jgi:hypothetical protein
MACRRRTNDRSEGAVLRNGGRKTLETQAGELPIDAVRETTPNFLPGDGHAPLVRRAP